jgi:hypothetical protein
MVPQTKIDFPLYVQGARLPPGHYSSEVTIFYTGGHVVHAVFGFTISTKQVRQTFGSSVPGNASATLAKSSSVPIWAIALGALALVAASIGLSALFFRRRTREREA